MAFKPTFDSNAEVIHHPTFLFSASSIHSRQPENPPCSEGFSTMYCGWSASNSLRFASRLQCPISSSSKAMGKGETEVSPAISSHCPARMGCSMECKSSSANRFSLSKASAGAKAPLASTRSSTSRAGKCRRMKRNKSSSSSKPMAPIFNLTQRKPASNFSLICLYMASWSPIHINPLMQIPSSPREKGVSHKAYVPRSRWRKAVSNPNSMEGYSLHRSVSTCPVRATSAHIPRNTPS